MRKTYNLTPHSIQVYPVDAFVNLREKNSCLVADGVDTSLILENYPASGLVARVETRTDDFHSFLPGITKITRYGQVVGMPGMVKRTDTFIVSLPTKSAATDIGLAKQMVTPYNVVRLAGDTGTILGCQGFTF